MRRAGGAFLRPILVTGRMLCLLQTMATVDVTVTLLKTDSSPCERTYFSSKGCWFPRIEAEEP
jgi:hypothetical protein